jgi:RES domain-containing protein
VRFQGVCYRGHDPRWAWSPTSGEGAAANGGRFNPVGTPALYLALTLEGMFAEMSHGFGHRFDPLTVCTYDVDVEDVVDLRTNKARAAERVGLSVLSCAWAYERMQGRLPPSWALAKRLIAKGVAGILVPSSANGATAAMTNLVLWRWSEALPHMVRVFDPKKRLPRDQSSWGEDR